MYVWNKRRLGSIQHAYKATRMHAHITCITTNQSMALTAWVMLLSILLSVPTEESCRKISSVLLLMIPVFIWGFVFILGFAFIWGYAFICGFGILQENIISLQEVVDNTSICMRICIYMGICIHMGILAVNKANCM